MNRAHYPADWRAVRAKVLVRASNRCECAGECGVPHVGIFVPDRCDLINGTFAQMSRERRRCAKVVLTTAHQAKEGTRVYRPHADR